MVITNRKGIKIKLISLLYITPVLEIIPIVRNHFPTNFRTQISYFLRFYSIFFYFSKIFLYFYSFYFLSRFELQMFKFFHFLEPSLFISLHFEILLLSQLIVIVIAHYYAINVVGKFPFSQC